MGSSSKSAPAPTPPKKTAAAANSTNLTNAITNAYLGNINEYGPDGSTRFEKTGTESVYDPFTGVTSEIPTFSRYTELSPEQQAIKEQGDATSLNLATLGKDLSGTLGGHLTDNFTLDNESTESRLFELGSKRLDPKFEERQAALETQLSNQGIKRGSEAFDRAMRDFGETRNDAYNQLLLTGRGQAANEQFAEDNQRINQISALMSGGQVSQPNFMGANMPTVANTDVAGLIANNDNARYNRWAQGQASQNDLLGGIMGMGANLMLSDENAKVDIKKVGKVEGENVYSYRYKDDGPKGPKQIGVLAQEVEKRHPNAVVKGSDGYKRVNYGEVFGMGKSYA
jgi:hypothetical protein